MNGTTQSGVGKLGVVLLCVGLSACFGAKKKPRLPVPPPPAPVVRPEPLPMPEVSPAPEVLQTPEVLPAPNVKSVPAPARMPPAARPARPKPVPTAPAPPTPKPPLGAILSATTEQQFRVELDQLIVRARAVVERSNGQMLTGTQRETVERIKSFLEQANAARDKDAATALQLARRADLLGQDLAKSLPRE